MNVSCSLITFRIDIDFPDCDVDVELIESAGRIPPLTIPGVEFHHTILPNSKTPTSASVYFCLNYLMGCARKLNENEWEIENGIEPLPEFEELKVEVTEIYELCQGTCHLIFTVDFDLFSAELVKKVTEIVSGVFNKYIVFYDT